MANKKKVQELSFIGYSTSIFDEYASANDLRTQIMRFTDDKEPVDVGNVVYNCPNCTYLRYIPDNTVLQYDRSGESLNEYGRSFQSNLKVKSNVKLFPAELGLNALKDSAQKRSTKFYSKDYVQKLGTFMFTGINFEKVYKNPEAFGIQFDPCFKDDLDGDMTPSDFFDMYGTHWIRQIIVGGRTNLTFMSKEDTLHSSVNLASKANAAFEVLAENVEAGVDNSWKQNMVDKDEKVSFRLTAKGGNTYLAGTNPKEWKESVLNDPTVVSFGSSSEHVLVPLWEFLPKGSRRSELEQAFEKLCTRYRFDKAVEPVKFFAYPNFSGLECELQIGEYNDLSTCKINDNNIDSLIVPEDVVVTAWIDKDFKKKRFGPYKGPMNISKVYGQNKWSSLKIELDSEVDPFVELFAFKNFDHTRKCTSVFAGDYSELRELNLEDWHNNIESIKVPKGLELFAWSDKSYEGTMYGPFSDQELVLTDKDGRNLWSSMKIIKTKK